MHQFHGHGAFADPGGDPFGGAMAHVARHEDARHTGFEVEGIAIRAPAARTPVFLLDQMLPGDDVAEFIALHHPGEPIGAGNRAGIDQQGARRDGLLLARLLVLDDQFFASLRAPHLDDLGVQAQ